MSADQKESLASDIWDELLSILRIEEDLSRPFDSFCPDLSRPADKPRFYVAFDARPRLQIDGLKIKTNQISLPDQRILDEVFNLAKAVWHLKDRLSRWALVAGKSANETKANKLIHNVTKQSLQLRISGDLANKKKHGESRNNFSGLNPRLSLVHFDVSKNNPVEFYYNGAKKQKELVVTRPSPIPFRVDIEVDPNDTVFGNALNVLQTAFRAWIPLIFDLGVLEGDHGRAENLRNELDSLAATS